MRQLVFLLMIVLFSFNRVLAGPIFSVTPLITGQSQLQQGQQGTAVYQITNNTPYNFTSFGLYQLPQGISAVTNGGYQYCSFPLSLNSGANCLIKFNIDSTQTSSVQGGPVLCYSSSKPIYCSQPFQQEQLSTQTASGPASSSCSPTASSVSNFNYELTQTIDSSTIDASTINSWGPARNQLIMSSSNPNLHQCTTTNITNTNNIQWMQNRLLASELFWVNQKLNYCHHHVVDFATPPVSYGTPRAQISSGGGFCSTATDLMPGSVYYGQSARWNLTGTASETIDNWNNNNGMWHGVDCSDFTSFAYNFAFGIQFNSDTGYQAGQATDGSQNTLTPNGQTSGNTLQAFSNSNPNSPAGVLVCKDGKTEQEEAACGGYGTDGYFSVFRGSDYSHPYYTISDQMLQTLQPGDLIFLGFSKGAGDGNNSSSVVTHVITWTGKKVGYGTNDINPSLIAPESICPMSDWAAQVGDWVIIDSHYQGPDYRVFSSCFYGNNIWGVRRVIGYMQAS